MSESMSVLGGCCGPHCSKRQPEYPTAQHRATAATRSGPMQFVPDCGADTVANRSIPLDPDRTQTDKPQPWHRLGSRVAPGQREPSSSAGLGLWGVQRGPRLGPMPKWLDRPERTRYQCEGFHYTQKPHLTSKSETLPQPVRRQISQVAPAPGRPPTTPLTQNI